MSVKPNLHRLSQTLNYTFSDPSLLQTALTHRSVGRNNNERLEFLGDSILNFLISAWLFQDFPTASEGQLSRQRAKLVKGETLAEIGRDLKLGDYLALGPGECKSGGHHRNSIIADAVEAIIGAMYLDGGIAAVQPLLKTLYTQRLADLPADQDLKDPKTRLQEHLQSQQADLPTYTLSATSGAAHAQHFTVTCDIANPPCSTQGEGSSRRRAEQQAAQNMLKKLAEKNHD